MSFLSATVPVITEEDEMTEFKSLTEQEQASVAADVFGLSYDNAIKQPSTPKKHGGNWLMKSVIIQTKVNCNRRCNGVQSWL